MNRQDDNGDCALTLACHRRNLQVVEELLKMGADVDVHDHRYGRTGLLWACSEKHSSDVVKALIGYGADVNQSDKEGCTALMEATVMSEVESIQQLLNAGGKINQQDYKGRTALVHAASWVDHGDAIQKVAINGHTEMVRLLIQAGVDLNWSNADNFEEGYKSGQTALYKAVWKGHEEIIHLLIKHGADLDAVGAV